MRKIMFLAALSLLPASLGGCAAMAVGATGYLFQGGLAAGALAAPSIINSKNTKQQAPPDMLKKAWADSPNVTKLITQADVDASQDAYTKFLTRGYIGTVDWHADHAGSVKVGPETLRDNGKPCKDAGHEFFNNGKLVDSEAFVFCAVDGRWVMLENSKMPYASIRNSVTTKRESATH